MATSLQFNIRSLLIAMVVTAVVLAAGLPVVRTWGTASQLHFVVNAAILAGLIGITIVMRCIMRRRIERQAGEVVLRAATQGNRFVRILHVVMLVLFLAGLLFMAAGEALADGAASRPLYAKIQWVNAAYLAWMAAWLMTNCWWATGPGIAELAENGMIVTGAGFLPYSQFKNIRWNHYFPDTLMFSGPQHHLIQIVVPSSNREQVEAILKQKGLTVH